MEAGPILVLTTGGTIDKTYFDACSAYQVGSSIVGSLLDTARATIPFRIEEVLRKDSIDMDEADREALRARAERASERRIVVTHGTDTMTDTARVLAGVANKTIVLTGALSPARFQYSDASFNLGMAFACCQTAQPGIYIAMNGSIFDGLQVEKDRDRAEFRTTAGVQ